LRVVLDVYGIGGWLSGAPWPPFICVLVTLRTNLTINTHASLHTLQLRVVLDVYGIGDWLSGAPRPPLPPPGTAPDNIPYAALAADAYLGPT
jgi:hypothetical protein